MMPMPTTISRHRKTLALLLLATALPPAPFHVEADQSNSDNSSYAANPSPYIGIIFLLFTALIIFATVVYYYLRERCHSRRQRRHLHSAAASILTTSHRGREGGGLNPDLVKAFPELTYSEARAKDVAVGPDCAVCLSSFEDDETLRLLPKCGHAFHPDCVGAWLASHTTCPCCRTDLILVAEKELTLIKVGGGSTDVVIDFGAPERRSTRSEDES